MAAAVNQLLGHIDAKVGAPLSSLFGDDQGRVVLITTLVSLFSLFPAGYHMVVLNVPEKIILKSMNSSLNTFGIQLTPAGLSVLWSTTVSCQALGALIGCCLVARVEERYGAKAGERMEDLVLERVSGLLSVANGVLASGSLLASLAAFLPFAPFLLIGRVLTGVHTGLVCALTPLFVQQIAPKRIKGSLSCFMHISVCFGSAMAAILSLDFMLGGDVTWGVLLLVPGILAGSQMTISEWIPDTPNHLLHRGSINEAVRSIKFYYDVGGEDEEVVIGRYWDTISEVPAQASFWSVLRHKDYRLGIFLGCVVSATQVFSGSMASISYSSSMFNAVSFLDVLVPFLPAFGSILSIILTLPALQLVESSGRRPVLMWTLLVCVLADILLLVFSLLSRDDWWASWAFGLAFLLYGIGYNMGVGPVAYFLPAELVGDEAAATALGAAVATNWVCSLISTLTFYPLNEAFGGWSYLLFIIPTSVLSCILWFFLPETRYHYMEDPMQRRLLQELGPIYGSLSGIA